ncbi:serine/threonine-protein phosphatase [Sarcoptes scabiei]|nr:serine/threonine-protein phosphatase [Sarcoptes scabiei]
MADTVPILRLEQSSRENSILHNYNILLLVLIVLCSFVSLLIVYSYFPKLEPNELIHFKLPRNIDDAKNLAKVLSNYKDRYFFIVYIGFIVTYIFLQSFAIPGSIFLSVISGFLFPFSLALLSVCFCSAVGASVCFLLSLLCGRPVILKYFPEKALSFSNVIDQHRHHLLYYIIFLRITPFLPNWLINIASPIVNVPIGIFFIGTFIGVAPPSFVAVQAGTALYSLTSSSNIVTMKNLFVLIAFSLLSFVPIVLKKYFDSKFLKEVD